MSADIAMAWSLPPEGTMRAQPVRAVAVHRPCNLQVAAETMLSWVSLHPTSRNNQRRVAGIVG